MVKSILSIPERDTDGKIIVSLTPADTTHWQRVARDRIEYVRRHGLGNRHGENTVLNGERNHKLGACGEKAVSLLLGIPWDEHLGIVTLSDVGHYEVRAIDQPNRSLILHKEDKDAAIFILVVLHGEFGAWHSGELAGWLYGHEGKHQSYWRDPTGENRWAFFVPNRRPPLYQMILLPTIERKVVA